jgi:hypothetical protein
LDNVEIRRAWSSLLPGYTISRFTSLSVELACKTSRSKNSKGEQMKRTILASLSIIIGIVFAGFTFSEWREQRKIDKQGIEVAVVTPSTYKRVKQRFGDKYRVDLKFITASGSSTTVTRSVSRGVIDQFESGQVVKLKYLADDMSMMRVNGDSSSELWIGIAVTLFFLIVGVVMFGGRRDSSGASE